VPFGNSRKFYNDGGVEPTAVGFSKEDRQGFVVRESFAVGTIGGQRVVDVRDLQNSGIQGDSFAAQAIGIAAAVHFFMVMPDDWENRAK